MTKKAQWPRRLRSQEWYGGTSRDVIYHRGWMKNQGYPHDLFDGRPVIGILNTWSDMTPCNGHLRELAEKVKAGIWEAGGFPMEVPVFSASENTFRPTAMMYRNLAALAIEETIRGQPMDGCVLMVGCDKTTPSLIMAAGVSWLLFTWMIARLPRESVSFGSAMEAGAIAAVGYELFKQAGSVYLQSVINGPAGAVFGPVLGLLVFAYITARAAGDMDRLAFKTWTWPAV